MEVEGGCWLGWLALPLPFFAPITFDEPTSIGSGCNPTASALPTTEEASGTGVPVPVSSEPASVPLAANSSKASQREEATAFHRCWRRSCDGVGVMSSTTLDVRESSLWPLAATPAPSFPPITRASLIGASRGHGSSGGASWPECLGRCSTVVDDGAAPESGRWRRGPFASVTSTVMLPVGVETGGAPLLPRVTLGEVGMSDGPPAPAPPPAPTPPSPWWARGPLPSPRALSVRSSDDDVAGEDDTDAAGGAISSSRVDVFSTQVQRRTSRGDSEMEDGDVADSFSMICGYTEGPTASSRT